MKKPRSLFQCRWLIISVLIVHSGISFSQNFKCRKIPTNSPVRLDTLLIELNSVQVSSPFSWNDSTQVIHIENPKDSLEVCYRVISSVLTKPYQNRSLAIYDDSRNPRIGIQNVSSVEKEELFEFGGINKYGSITRSISFGNRQNLFVNSSLNLQMEGKLDENLNISAVITDQNVPYQPEGNTQQIRDFDNVFIKLYNSKFDVTVGDIVLKQLDDAGYFLRYFKNVQGIQASYRGSSGKWKHEFRASGALSKGKFNSAIVSPVDGLSGPYKLRGPNGERFIIVLANSEKVFIDGKLLERGFDRDYVIDYNLGEITFNNHIIITQFTIIRVDFEYAEQFYSRSNISAHQSVSNDKIKVFVNYYRERDNPNSSFGFKSNEKNLTQLRGIGDNIDLAFVTGFDSVRFSENRILYLKKETTDFDGNTHTIFEYSVNPNEELFSPTFSDVGFGLGDYVLKQTIANGRVYEWVSPQGGQSQGNYKLGAFIPLPNSRQMITMGGKAKLSSYETVSAEVAFSSVDKNLYSNIDDEDNISRAYFTSIATKGRKSIFAGYTWLGAISVEYDETDFRFIDRYRPILFDRDWNFKAKNAIPSGDILFFAKGGIGKDENNRLEVSINRRKRSSAIDGWQQQVDFNEEFGNFKLTSSHFRLHNDQQEMETVWNRSRSSLSYRKWKVAPGYIYELNQNKISQQDNIVASLMNFQAHEIYFTNTDSSKAVYRIGYEVRKDRLPIDGKLEDYLFSKNLRGSFGLEGDKGSVSADFNYRKVDDKLDRNIGEDEVINGRVNWTQSFLKGNLKSNFSFSTGNSRELKREFIYLPVNAGDGTHTWRDINGDGVQDLNEFFEAINLDERNYAKIITPTDDYVTSFQTFYLHTIEAGLPRSWGSQGGFKQFMAKFSANINFNVNFKITSESYLDRLNPFGFKLSDENVISSRDSKRYTLFFKKNEKGFAGDFTHQTLSNKQLLIQGYETREKDEWIFNAKMDLSSEHTFKITSMIGNLLNRSDYLDSRNFEIVTITYRPQLIWQPSNAVRVIGSFEFKNKKNQFTEASNESVASYIYMTELTWSKTGKGSFRSSFSLLKIDFKGNPSSYLGYLLLDAFQPGINQTLQINWQQKISKGIQLSVFYNGRKSENAQVIHTGSMQMTLFF